MFADPRNWNNNYKNHATRENNLPRFDQYESSHIIKRHGQNASQQRCTTSWEEQYSTHSVDYCLWIRRSQPVEKHNDINYYLTNSSIFPGISVCSLSHKNPFVELPRYGRCCQRTPTGGNSNTTQLHSLVPMIDRHGHCLPSPVCLWNTIKTLPVRVNVNGGQSSELKTNTCFQGSEPVVAIEGNILVWTFSLALTFSFRLIREEERIVESCKILMKIY